MSLSLPGCFFVFLGSVVVQELTLLLPLKWHALMGHAASFHNKYDHCEAFLSVEAFFAHYCSTDHLCHEFAGALVPALVSLAGANQEGNPGSPSSIYPAQLGNNAMLSCRAETASHVAGVGEGLDLRQSVLRPGKQHTMMDAMFMAFSGGEKETAMSMAMKLLMQYIVNLTMGIIGAFVFFVYNVYTLVVSYGESALSGLAFFLLVVVAGMATVGTYLVAIYGTVAGGGIFLLKQAAKQAAVEGGRAGARPRQVQYGGGRVGGQRSHYD
ncbi:unnamed protein product [Polarella glacialis]|uniref:Uncharacterized protein n=1 Tax=Polarella glacialis TaxID=89957 RepID=A0A813L9L0_POLGL|nr:unnamed protein product [Polarella glacialis]